MSVFFLIIFKTAIFLISYYAVANITLNFLKKRKPFTDFWDIEVIVVSVIAAAFITSAIKSIIKNI